MLHASSSLPVLAAAALFCGSPLAAQGAPGRTLEFTGLVIVNGFSNSNTVNNADVPQWTLPDTAARRGGVGGTARQTRLGLFLTQPDVLGGTFSGEVDVDFFGGQLGDGGRTMPLLRLRRLVARVNWRRAEVMVAQEAPLISEISPRSLASIGIPGFAGAGNLWFWMPQVRATVEFGEGARVALQGAVIAPMTGDPQGTFTTQPDSAELSDRPFLQGRVRLGWGDPSDGNEVGVGVHQGWLVETDTSLHSSQAIAVSGRARFGKAELRGEWYTGQGLAVLGWGGIGRNLSPVDGQPLEDQAGWVQLNLRPRPIWEFGAGVGYDEPQRSQLDETNPAQALRNLVWAIHATWQPSGPIVLGFAYQRIETEFGGATGTLTNDHLNLQAGFRF
jgi:hypothetical protein